MPRTIASEQWLTFLTALRDGYSRRDAGRMAGISERTVSRFMTDHPSSSGRRYLRQRQWAQEQLERIAEPVGSVR